jgi:hypothetical protein
MSDSQKNGFSSPLNPGCHRRSTAASGKSITPVFRRLSIRACTLLGSVPPLRQSRALGVGHDPCSFAAVGKSGVSSAHNSPSRIKPQVGKVAKHSVEPSNNMI